MSRIGKKPIDIPTGVKINVNNNIILIEASNGKLEYRIPDGINVKTQDNLVVVTRKTNSKNDRSLHGLVRALILNMIIGVTKGYEKSLDIQGVGYRAQVQGQKLTLQLGFSHPIEFTAPDGINIETNKQNQIIIKGADKVKVGEVAAEIRSFCKPEPYKGKGIKYTDEQIKRKAGKSVA